jgi:CRISPR-associated protein Csx14
MSPASEPTIGVGVDPANPGQFFACCGLLELADRLWSGAEAWFDAKEFFLRSILRNEMSVSISELVRAIAVATLEQTDPTNETSSPILIGEPFNLRLDWWEGERAGGEQLKVWAGSMRGFRIARAMQTMMNWEEAQTASLLDYAVVVRDPDQPDNKVEPFYFDARRGANSLPLDIGFSPDALQMTNLAYPAVEFLCLVGLQRFRPNETSSRRVFDYHTWSFPLSAEIAPVAVAGLIADSSARAFRFENGFRTDQRKHKAFNMATPIAR